MFLPLCDFSATLVLSESQAQAGLAWYNEPATPTGAPTPLHPIWPRRARRRAGDQQRRRAQRSRLRRRADRLRADADVQRRADAGLLLGVPAQRELHRSARCPATGRWCWSYPVEPDVTSYYLAFEDWEGANDSTWFGNDGDFNDKVFKITRRDAATAAARPCTTEQPGVCAHGRHRVPRGRAATLQAGRDRGRREVRQARQRLRRPGRRGRRPVSGRARVQQGRVHPAVRRQRVSVRDRPALRHRRAVQGSGVRQRRLPVRARSASAAPASAAARASSARWGKSACPSWARVSICARASRAPAPCASGASASPLAAAACARPTETCAADGRCVKTGCEGKTCARDRSAEPAAASTRVRGGDLPGRRRVPRTAFAMRRPRPSRPASAAAVEPASSSPASRAAAAAPARRRSGPRGPPPASRHHRRRRRRQHGPKGRGGTVVWLRRRSDSCGGRRAGAAGDGRPPRPERLTRAPPAPQSPAVKARRGTAARLRARQQLHLGHRGPRVRAP